MRPALFLSPLIICLIGSLAPEVFAMQEAVRPALQENERLFGISVERLLTVDGRRLAPHEVYRKVEAAALKALKA